MPNGNQDLYQIYTDGSCLKNPNGPGGWAFALIKNDEIILGSGNNPSTTNNRMELQAVIEALLFLEQGNYPVYTDSKWVINCATGKWKRKANLDLWTQYDKIIQKFNIQYNWVRGHNGNKYNEVVDNLAREEAKSIKV
jgi:ribonuclease HI